MIELRIYYIFNIKKEVYDLYIDTPSVLYNFFYFLYHDNKDNLDFSNTIFSQITNKFNKEYLDLKIYLNMHKMMRYLKRKEEHIINDLFKDQISIMKINNSYIIINSTKNNTEFFNIINYYYKNCLVCDFSNHEYFYINRIKMLV